MFLHVIIFSKYIYYYFIRLCPLCVDDNDGILFFDTTHTYNRKEELDTLSAIEEFLDFSNNALDEIWRLPYLYPQNRMKNVLDLLCKRLKII